MTSLPGDLALRLTKLFTKEEMMEVESAFKQIKRPPSFRVNTLKASLKNIKNILDKAHINYELYSLLPNCIILKSSGDEIKLRSLDIYKNGNIYMQSISSQIPVGYFENKSMDSKEPRLKILDTCAAPGGKTSQLAAIYPEAEIWAFEPSKIRYERMKYNFKKLGVSTCDKHSLLKPLPFLGKGATVICINDKIENLERYLQTYPPLQKEGGTLEYFDMILIDAPCSGEGGLSYHNTSFLENWSLSYIKKNYARQKAICDAVLPFLKTEGEMIYSTCTLAPEENEAVIHYLLCKYQNLNLEKLDFIENKYIKYKLGLKSFGRYIFRKEISERTLRVIPSKYSEGFYIAKLKKGGHHGINDLK
ncbi:RsmB/NOP family class I SAM-dependent RNA methyltransferase [Candidatus Gracilibacteria bacterium]|nr:RsmB/NOP family class I SAM-dependent RNA methyltransferase [Candidatus Gracilibacteria bacterium]